MIDIEDAIQIAQRKIPAHPVDHVYDLSDKWLVTYYGGAEPVPGLRACLVNKKDGSTSYYFPPDYIGIRPSEHNRVR